MTQNWSPGTTNANGHTFDLFLMPAQAPDYFSNDIVGAQRYSDVCATAGLRSAIAGYSFNQACADRCQPPGCVPTFGNPPTNDLGEYTYRQVGWDLTVVLDLCVTTVLPKFYNANRAVLPPCSVSQSDATACGFGIPLQPICGTE